MSYLKEINGRKNATIPESVFVDIMLPLLVDPDPSKFNKAWRNVAGGLYNTVDLLSEDGTVILTIPAIRSSGEVKADDTTQYLGTNIHLQSGISLAHGAAAMRRLLPEISNFGNSRSKADMDKWRDILVTYGYGSYVADDDVKKEKLDSNFIVDEDDGW